MDATTLSSKTANTLIERLKKDYPAFKFKEGAEEHWSPKTNTIFYNLNHPPYGVLHELAHAQLGHSTYSSDFELLKLESNAWELAVKIGKKYGVTINEGHIQNCLDTYRDWLHKRSTCPSCGTHVLQKNPKSYSCFNCHTSWQVTSDRFVRPYRKLANKKTA